MIWNDDDVYVYSPITLRVLRQVSRNSPEVHRLLAWGAVRGMHGRHMGLVLP